MRIVAANLSVAPNASNADKLALGDRLNSLWSELEGSAADQMVRDGFHRDTVQYRRQAMVRYSRQLDDLIVPSPVDRIRTPQDLEALITAFEAMYSEIYASAARFPQAGYDIFEVGLIASVPKIKPKLRKHPMASPEPPAEARKGQRRAWFSGERLAATVLEWDRLRAGNVVSGPAIVESPTTTMVVPPSRKIHVDEHLALWLQ